LYGENGGHRRSFEAFYSSLVGDKYDGNSVATFTRHFGKEPNDLRHKWREFIMSLEPKSTEDLVAAATAAYTDYIDFTSAQNFAAKALEQMKDNDHSVLLCNARLYLNLGRWVSDPELQAMHYAKSVEFFQQVFPEAEPGKRVSKPRKVTTAFARDRLDYARACVGAVDYERAQDLIEEVLSRKEFEFSAAGYSVMAYLAVMAKDPAFHSLALAKEYAALANDLGADQEIAYVKAQIALAEDRRADAIKLLNEAASRDEFGFGGLFYRREMARLTGETRRAVEEPKPAKDGK
jgi:tetratricopeptide (TPR) repeat protein